MTESEFPSQPCYSMRLARPFLTVLRTYPGFPVEILAPLEAMDPDERIPIAAIHELLEAAVAMSHDPDLGLKAAMAMTEGDYGVVEYAARSARTYGDAIAVIGRFMPLLNDAIEFRLEIDGTRAAVHLDSSVVLPRVGADFQAAAFHLAERMYRPDGSAGESEVLFTHPRPVRTEVYEQVFDDARLVFDAPFNGFAFDVAYLQRALPTADDKLNALMRRHAELMLAGLPKAESVTELVRGLIAKELSGGNPSVEHVAGALHISPRTLGRKLEQEGTTFRDLFDDLRRRMAQQYLGSQDLGLSEIAFLLGFSQSAAFHRAFKRWTGQTPLDYRRARRG